MSTVLSLLATAKNLELRFSGQDMNASWDVDLNTGKLRSDKDGVWTAFEGTAIRKFSKDGYVPLSLAVKDDHVVVITSSVQGTLCFRARGVMTFRAFCDIYDIRSRAIEV